MFLRADIPFSSNLSSVQNLICYHHYANLISKFESKQRYCCDPFDVHKTVKVFGRKVISLDLAKQLTISTNKKIKPGYKLCRRSQSQQGKDTKSIEEGEIDSSATSSTSETTGSESMDSVKRISFDENAKEKTNRSLAAIGESPINLHSISKEHRLSYSSKKTETASKSLATSFTDATCVDINDIVTDNDDFTSNFIHYKVISITLPN